MRMANFEHTGEIWESGLWKWNLSWKVFIKKLGHFATYHFLVSWKIRLLNKWKLIFAQLLLNFDQLSKTPWPVLKRQNNFTSKAFGFHVLDIGLGKRPSFLLTLQWILCARLTGLWTFPNAWRSKERIVDGKCIPQTVGQQRRERRYKSKGWNGNEYRGEPVQKNVCFPIAITRKPLLVFWPVFVAITIEAHHKKGSKWMVVTSNFSRLHNLMKSLIRERDKNLGNCKKFSLQLQTFATFSLSLQSATGFLHSSLTWKL